MLRLMTVSEGQVWGVCDDLLDGEERVGLCESIHVIACQADSLGKRAKRLSDATVVLIEKERERDRLEKQAAVRKSPRAKRSQSKAWQPLKHEKAAVRKGPRAKPGVPASCRGVPAAKPSQKPRAATRPKAGAGVADKVRAKGVWKSTTRKR